MSTSQLDRIVKGAPPPNVSPEQVAQSARRSSSASTASSSITAPHPPLSIVNDPLSNLPSSPECIYRNLLILEASLRAQYLSLRARLKLYLVLMAALAAWVSTFTYLLFLRPREDGKGAGGSPYWVVDVAEKTGWVGGLVTVGLVWATGMWDRGVRWPRRWIAISNRGLRSFNLKLVIIRRYWYREVFSYLALTDLISGRIRGMRFEFLPKDIEKYPQDSEKSRARLWEYGGREGWIEEDIAPGGDAVKLLLLPKPFSPDFREDWDTFRTAYWEKENERRAQLRKIVKERNNRLAKQEGGWLWWAGWRGWNTFRRPKRPEMDKRPSGTRERPANPPLRREKRRESLLREHSHSRSSSVQSRSSTPDSDMRHPRKTEGRLRRESSAAGVPRSKRNPSSFDGSTPTIPRPKPSPLTRSGTADSRPPPASRSGSTVSDTPLLHKRSSNLSINSSASDDTSMFIKKDDTPPTDLEALIKEEEDEEEGKS